MFGFQASEPWGIKDRTIVLYKKNAIEQYETKYIYSVFSFAEN